MPDIELSVSGVLKLLTGLNPSKAAGSDAIKPVVLTELANEIAPVFTAIFKLSLETGTVPADWKTAIVSPGDKGNPANYRPISLTCILCKTMEHIIASNLTRHFDKHNVLYDLQHGFCECRSCETKLFNLLRTFLDYWQWVSKLTLFYLILVKPSTRWITSNRFINSGYMVFKVMSWIGSSPFL